MNDDSDEYDDDIECWYDDYMAYESYECPTQTDEIGKRV